MSDDDESTAPDWQETEEYSNATAVFYFLYGPYMLLLFSIYLFNLYRLSQSSTPSTTGSKGKKWSNLTTTLALACYLGVSVTGILHFVLKVTSRSKNTEWISCPG